MRCSVISTYQEVAQAPRASLPVKCADNEAYTDKFCTDGESDKGGLVIRTVPIMIPTLEFFFEEMIS